MDDKPRIKDLNRFSLFVPMPNVPNQRARLSWSIRAASPRISIFYFNPATNKNEVMAVFMAPEVFFVFLDQFEELIKNNQTGAKYKIENYLGIKDAQGKQTADRRLVNELYYGLDAEGMAWLSVVEGDKPRLKFTFSLWDYSKIFKPDGTQLSESEASKAYALTAIKALRDIYTMNMSTFAEYGKPEFSAKSSSVKVDESVLEDLNF